MSVESMSLALHHSRAQGTTKLVLLGIANHDGDGGAWPTVATLAKYAGGVNERTVRRAIAELVDLGEVVVHVNAGGDRNTRGDQRPNLYEVVLTCPDECDRSKNHRIDGRTLVSSRPDDGGTPVSEREDIGVRNGGAPVPAEPSLNLPFNQESARKRDDAPSAAVGELSPYEDLGGRTAPPPPLLHPDRCPRHQHDAVPPPCGACGAARRAHEAALVDAARADAVAERQRRRAEARLAREAIAACGWCDDDGYIHGRPCDHVHPEHRAQTARSGADAARAAAGLPTKHRQEVHA